MFEQLRRSGRFSLCGVPDGYEAYLLAEIAQELEKCVVLIARDELRAARVREGLAFFAPNLTTLSIPAWDCIPYDRVSPHPDIVSRRLETLDQLVSSDRAQRACVILTSVAAALQRLPPRQAIANAVLSVAKGDRLEPTTLITYLIQHGYARAETVAERGDFAVRGGIVDTFPPGLREPVRFDFFGDEVDSIRTFDAGSQRTTGQLDRCRLKPVSEVFVDSQSVACFRSGYRSLFGAVGRDDPLYAAVSSGHRYTGMEHWLPLFHSSLETLFDYVTDAVVVLDDQFESIRDARLDQIAEHFATRKSLEHGKFSQVAQPYKPVPPERMFLDGETWDQVMSPRAEAQLSAFAGTTSQANVIELGAKPALDFAAARSLPDVNVFNAVLERIEEYRTSGRKTLIAVMTKGSLDRLATILREHGLVGASTAETWHDVVEMDATAVALGVLPLDRGFVTPEFAVISEQDILGDRIARRGAKRARPDAFLTEASSLSTGDLVVHVDHGIGRYDGLEAIAVDGAPHDCLRLIYAGNDKLYLPVENIEVISRYGGDSDGAALDRLGGAAWQSRKARLKERIREIADDLIQLAAARSLRDAPVMTAAEGAFDEFCSRFPYNETDDQARAIDEVLADLAAGRPTDRLICGDVGFGKTEVAMRAAFVTALEGRQVAVVVPTTLLCRQHYATFSERFSGFPLRIGELSRLVSASTARVVKRDVADGKIDVIVGTHALLAKDVRFSDLGLVIVDEEQHFGVTHKERLKRLQTDVHVLTLTATPIPRTLQLALTGVREMSLIATPPVDRLAVRTFVTEFDPVVVREAILREQHRGGQVFYVCPRIEHLDEVAKILAELVPESRVVMAHGRMTPRKLEDAVGAFYEGQFHILLSTNIIESGLDLPSVNTIIIHRSDLFGLAQLYQLRGRVGRGKIRAYAYLTVPPKRKLTPAAERRLHTMQALDALGAGFTLASHDLDIRGAGNLLGDEQSGHIREVGIELYQQMLEDAVAEARSGDMETAPTESWSPQLSLGLSVLIPENYVPDLGVRLGLYRRLADLKSSEELDAFAAELVDRFGDLPDAVRNLLDITTIKQMCRRVGVDKIEAGPKGAVIAFRETQIKNPEKLIAFIAGKARLCKLRPDHKLVYRQFWETPGDRLVGVRRLLSDLSKAGVGV